MKKATIMGLMALALTSCSKDFSDAFMAPSISGIESAESSGDKFDDFKENQFINTKDQPASTFSVDADGASFAVVRNYLNNGWAPSKGAVRIEEFLNYFPFDYAEPQSGRKLAINAEVGECPWDDSHKLVRLGLKGKSLSASERPLANYVFLVDVSGSMSSQNKLPLLKSGLISMLPELSPNDRISIVTYSGKVSKVLESTPVKEAGTIKKAIEKLTANGSTNGGEAIKMAYEEALSNYIPGGNNRIILGTDGDFNVGVTSTDELLEMVQNYCDKGIYLTALGFGMGNLNDSMMEKVSNEGNGCYFFIDSEDEMIKVFVQEKDKFISVVNDCKVQVTFDEKKVKSYRLIGYENRVMSSEDFENDKKDAGEIGAGQTITALYEIVPEDGYSGGDAVAKFDVKYKNVLGQNSESLSMTVEGLAEKSENLSFAAGVAAYGMVLRDSKFKGSASLEMSKQLVESALSFDPFGYRKNFLKQIDLTKKVME
ncbi:MAG: VWA domain-containing protein [Bacteroidales bacterium]|nr:VWA domain-containing protein [Bacteroidales bacterium]